MTPRVYLPQACASQNTLTLPEDTSAHLIRVLRMRQGDPLIVFDGSGRDWSATVLDANPKAVRIQLLTSQPGLAKSPVQIELGQAMLVKQKMDLVLQKSTELGVNGITPLRSKKGVVKLNTVRSEKQHLRNQTIVISACEQSGRSELPILQVQNSVSEWISTLPKEGLRLLCHPSADTDPLPAKAPKHVSIAIGPESGWHPDEIQIFLEAGFVPCQFGPRILRTETAALAIIASLQTRWGDF